MQYSRYAVKLSPVLKNKVVTTYSPPVFSLIAVVIFVIFAIRPTFKDIISLQQTIDQQKKVLTQLQAKSQDLSDAINSYNSIPDDTKLKIITLLPNSTDLTCLVSDLNNRSASAAITTSGEQVQSAELKGLTKCILDTQDLDQYRQNLPPTLDLTEVGYTINTTGSFSGLSDFLASFNTSTRLSNVETAIFNKTADGGNLNMILNAKAFYYK